MVQAVTVVIPCYNEAENLGPLFQKLEKIRNTSNPRYQMGFILVDDGSTDATGKLLDAQCVHQPALQVIHHPVNRGFGAALKTGLTAATGDIVVTIDADANYDHLEIFKILDHLTEGVDVVTASPFHPGGTWKYPPHRFILSILARTAYRLVLWGRAPKLYTYTSGFRVYRQSILKTILPDADNFAATVELLARALLKGYRVVEYPTIVYPRGFGHSKMKTLPTILAHLKLLWHLRCTGGRRD